MTTPNQNGLVYDVVLSLMDDYDELPTLPCDVANRLGLPETEIDPALQHLRETGAIVWTDDLIQINPL